MAKRTTKTSQPKSRSLPGKMEGRERTITCIAKFFEALSGFMKKESEFWFRGHADLKWKLTPSALRYNLPEQKQAALKLLWDFKRYAAIKLPSPPSRDDELQWVQLAQHHGLPTRLLDWTRNATIALYFACIGESTRASDGAVVMLNPKDLNRMATAEHRIFDAHSDADRISRYFPLPDQAVQSSLKTIAINPIWNSQRIMLQQGVFTLHGPKEPTLTTEHAPSLVWLRIPHTKKGAILQELEHAGINEMSIFPEPEHICRYLIWREKLNVSGAK